MNPAPPKYKAPMMKASAQLAGDSADLSIPVGGDRQIVGASVPSFLPIPGIIQPIFD